MRKFNIRIESKHEKFIIKSPTHTNYGIGCKVYDGELEISIVMGSFENKEPALVITNIDELPDEFVLWYASILANLKTVNILQQESEDVLPYLDIAQTNGGVIVY